MATDFWGIRGFHFVWEIKFLKEFQKKVYINTKSGHVYSDRIIRVKTEVAYE